MATDADHITLECMIAAAEAGGRQIRQLFGRDVGILEKSTPADFVTAADTRSESAVLRILKNRYPHHNYLSEEAGLENNGSNSCFVVDPLDGTNNFVIGLPHFVISIAEQYKEATAVSVVYHVLSQECFYARVDHGTRVGAKACRVNEEGDLSRAVISQIRSYNNDSERTLALYNELRRRGVQRILNTWAPAWDFVMLARGGTHGIIWDVPSDEGILECAAGKLMVREAGGLITDFDGNKDRADGSGRFVASNGTAIHDELLFIASSLRNV